ncbi:glutathione peroxidase [Terricaulis sp.]|uniref:glutathione peroxidase n=1 Tax=Terricaulis sp. TaxID=2768686 RepID=UPI003783AB92
MNRLTAALLLGLGLALAACNRAPPPPSAEVADQRTQAVNAAVQEQTERFASAPAATPADAGTAYQFDFEGLMTERVPMTAFRGEVVLVVNTASRCGYTPQYEGLQQIFSEYHGRGFEIVGVPSNDFAGQEPGSSEEIAEFCRLNYGVTFPMAEKVDVIGDTAHPFYKWAHEQLGQSAVPAWNFHKILVGRDGRLIAAWPSAVTPTSAELRQAIEAALGPANAAPSSTGEP